MRLGGVPAWVVDPLAELSRLSHGMGALFWETGSVSAAVFLEVFSSRPLRPVTWSHIRHSLQAATKNWMITTTCIAQNGKTHVPLVKHVIEVIFGR